MWQQEECLYNTQNKDYHNSTKRNSALERISVEIHVLVKELSKKNGRFKELLRTTQTES